jgi:hypothetical protein
MSCALIYHPRNKQWRVDLQIMNFLIIQFSLPPVSFALEPSPCILVSGCVRFSVLWCHVSVRCQPIGETFLTHGMASQTRKPESTFSPPPQTLSSSISVFLRWETKFHTCETKIILLWFLIARLFETKWYKFLNWIIASFARICLLLILFFSFGEVFNLADDAHFFMHVEKVLSCWWMT